ncbi:hypothetical protein EVAR_86393_1 [Eumeta japonica]|uniref:Uncharacterized protein n=1 Tax=Eumeta variegata TaxID=151549 RepID=A0A4C1WBE2_EUMVA|nr:hypothetical protein EVAR_86393_1 [Eumeta japonica]
MRRTRRASASPYARCGELLRERSPPMHSVTGGWGIDPKSRPHCSSLMIPSLIGHNVGYCANSLAGVVGLRDDAPDPMIA